MLITTALDTPATTPWRFGTHGASLRAPVERDLVDAVRRVLSEAEPEAAGALGMATHGLAGKMFDDVLKEMRNT